MEDKEANKELREKMYAEIQSQNNTLTTEYLESLSTQAVINYTHPLYRNVWQKNYDDLYLYP